MDLRNKAVLVLVQVREETLAEVFRKLMKDARASGFRKVIINVISPLPHWQVLASAREAILDNIDLGLEVYTWKPEDVKKMFEKASQLGVDGLMTYCDEDNKYSMSKLMSSLPDSLKISMIKDNCK
ncbi:MULTISPECIES: DUF5751 family protein [Metallosphaera]|uniref:DUF5751 family protein n=1 Tax=Metallosphaera TaxID=41980 RepID=UPI001F06D49D|nr:DUF5751 family protein [Metallosphaera sedula]MCH1771680.1 hypothetical protein [Metallosphaera sedula]MCP6728279.1 hypothetical protein [Metallosphaera sedula]BBL46693.1 hypothetical protein MJ1HA_0792 [Metallosphaera sedula]